MFYSMGPAGMNSSVTSVRSGSELSDSDMESSTHSLSSLTQPAALAAQVLPVSVLVSVHVSVHMRDFFFFSLLKHWAERH